MAAHVRRAERHGRSDRRDFLTPHVIDCPRAATMTAREHATRHVRDIVSHRHRSLAMNTAQSASSVHADLIDRYRRLERTRRRAAVLIDATYASDAAYRDPLMAGDGSHAASTR